MLRNGSASRSVAAGDVPHYGIDLMSNLVITCDYDVGVSSRWIHELSRHGSHSSLILLQHALAGAAALADIALDTPFKTCFLAEINKDFGAQRFTQQLPVEREEPFDDDKWTGHELASFSGTGVGSKVVNRTRDRLSVVELVGMAEKQV